MSGKWSEQNIEREKKLARTQPRLAMKFSFHHTITHKIFYGTRFNNIAEESQMARINRTAILIRFNIKIFLLALASSCNFKLLSFLVTLKISTNLFAQGANYWWKPLNMRQKSPHFVSNRIKFAEWNQNRNVLPPKQWLNGFFLFQISDCAIN